MCYLLQLHDYEMTAIWFSVTGEVFCENTFWPLLSLPTHNDTLELACRSA